MTLIAALEVADPPDLWADLGFTVEDGACMIGDIAVVLGAPGHGVVGWTLGGAGELAELPAGGALRALPSGGAPPTGLPSRAHPNGVTALDHVVVSTPDLDRTIGAFEGAGIPLRRTRDVPGRGTPMVQAFFRLDNSVVEVVGPARGTGSGPAGFYGLAFTVTDLDVTASVLGERLRAVKDAVQAGRRIASLDRAAGSSVPLAFMSPRG